LKLQNADVRIIHDSYHLDPSDNFGAFRSLSMFQIYDCVYRTLNHLLPNSSCQIHSYDTQNSNYAILYTGLRR